MVTGICRLKVKVVTGHDTSEGKKIDRAVYNIRVVYRSGISFRNVLSPSVCASLLLGLFPPTDGKSSTEILSYLIGGSSGCGS